MAIALTDPLHLFHCLQKLVSGFGSIRYSITVIAVLLWSASIITIGSGQCNEGVSGKFVLQRDDTATRLRVHEQTIAGTIARSKHRCAPPQNPRRAADGETAMRQ